MSRPLGVWALYRCLIAAAVAGGRRTGRQYGTG